MVKILIEEVKETLIGSSIFSVFFYFVAGVTNLIANESNYFLVEIFLFFGGLFTGFIIAIFIGIIGINLIDSIANSIIISKNSMDRIERLVNSRYLVGYIALIPIIITAVLLLW